VRKGTLLAFSVLCSLLAGATAWAAEPLPEWQTYTGEAVATGCVLANVAGRGLLMVPLSELEHRVEYSCAISCYSDPQASLNTPVSADAVLVNDAHVTFLGGYSARLTDARSRAAFRPVLVDLYERGLLPAAPALDSTHNLHLIVATSDDPPAPPAGAAAAVEAPWNGYGTDTAAWQPGSPLERRLLAAADEVRCGPVTLQVYQPQANRIEVSVQRREVWRELVYDGSVIPTLVERQGEFAPAGWVSSSLSAPDLGFLFADGTPMPDQAQQAEFDRRVQARTAQLAAAGNVPAE
jgi:hypothetical protein